MALTRGARKGHSAVALAIRSPARCVAFIYFASAGTGYRAWSPAEANQRGERSMTTRQFVRIGTFIAGLAALVGAALPRSSSLRADQRDISGVVTGPRGPEAG